MRESSEEAKPRFKRPSPVDRLVEDIVTTKHEDRGDEASSAPKNEESAETLELENKIAALQVSGLTTIVHLPCLSADDYSPPLLPYRHGSLS